MKIVTIEPTPSPNTMKVIIDQELPFGKSHNYHKDNLEGAPKEIQAILSIAGVKGVYHVADFLAVERLAKFDWETILAEVRRVFGDDSGHSNEEIEIDEHFGEIYVHVQQFKGIPLQVKVFDSHSEKRFAMPENFVAAMQAVLDPTEENYLLQRKWADYGVRYGEKEEIGLGMVEELAAAYPQERLDAMVEQNHSEEAEPIERGRKVTLEEFDVPDWETRFQLLEQMNEGELSDLALLAKALEDEKMSIRRQAAIYLGDIRDKAVVPLLEKAMRDKSWAVRRTAGDTISDLGFEEFEPIMMETLKDKNKLVRWRAAMFLYETGTEASLPALKEAENDPEFEVKLQIKMAIARIEQGEDAKGSVWKQMTEARQAMKEE
ncbi:conserved virulence factor C family protein [Planococcus shenhongbingii]|uniref:Conserved virulence factor C family protein n=1 Tax=Planococcus shenhongbingii TaxID=3058398 RepID=A0ABT8N8C2_9BACL|nr:conserved virulence factor C family protein [Planococcus sp. N017]MDN7243983.1 conserved virulence factor C family protein [Planococcus sp. N017]